MRPAVVPCVLLAAGCGFGGSGGDEGAADAPRRDGPGVVDARDDAPGGADALRLDCTVNPAYVTVGTLTATYRLLLAAAWVDGEATCELDFAHLVVFDTAQEAARLDGFIIGDAWVGVSDRVSGGVYRAVTDQPDPYVGSVSGDDSDPDVSCLRFKEGNDAIEVRDCDEAGNVVVCECDGMAAVPGSY